MRRKGLLAKGVIADLLPAVHVRLAVATLAPAEEAHGTEASGGLCLSASQHYFFLLGGAAITDIDFVVENDDDAPAGFALACFGFFFSRLLRC